MQIKSARFSSRSLFALALLAFVEAFGQPPKISEDRELKEFDLTGWNCLNHLEGSARTPDAIERNRLKNRSGLDLTTTRVRAMDTTSFLAEVATFDAETRRKRRKDLSPSQKAELDGREKQLVSLTGYLVLAYAGPPESTNCGSVDFHDWHLEVVAKPSDHPPEVGDPTPIICEITPRTQNAIYRDHIRIQGLAAFVRAPDFLSYEPTRHAARKIRLTGCFLWDDDHNGLADVGSTIRSIGANKFHQPWRSTAWEIHPVVKIEALDEVPAASPQKNPPPPSPSAQPSATSAAVAPVAPDQKFTTLTKEVRIRIPYGETVIPRGTKLPVVKRDDSTVTVQYLNHPQVIPIASTDLK
jgi:hypothetical protein